MEKVIAPKGMRSDWNKAENAYAGFCFFSPA